MQVNLNLLYSNRDDLQLHLPKNMANTPILAMIPAHFHLATLLLEGIGDSLVSEQQQQSVILVIV